VTAEPQPQPQAADARFVSVDVPAEVNAGASFTATFVLTNSGGTTWTRGAYHRLGSEAPRDNLTWGTPRLELPSDVPPGGTVTVVAALRAPETPGAHDFAWRMVQDGVSWFGETSAVRRIEVVGGLEASDEDPPVATAAEIRVTHAYNGILGREPDAGGLANWSTSLDDGTLSLVGLCAALFDSEEFATYRAHLDPEALAAELYWGILGREPDPEGLVATADAIRDGLRAERAADMLGSSEFAERFAH
jgi:hypothetical protein